MLFALVLAGLGCEEHGGPSVPDPLDVRLSPLDVFAGAEVVVSGDWYRTTGDTPEFVADSIAVAVRRVDDTTVAVTVPSTANGAVRLAERVGNTLLDRGLVTVYGFERYVERPVPMATGLTPCWAPGCSYVATGDSNGISIIDPRSDVVIHHPGIQSAVSPPDRLGRAIRWAATSS